MTREQTQNVKDLVIPVTMLGGLMTLAFMGGGLMNRVTNLESNQSMTAQTLKQVQENLTQMRIDDEHMRGQLDKSMATADRQKSNTKGITQ